MKKIAICLLMTASVANAAIYEKSLREMGMITPLRLEGVNASVNIKIPVSPRESIQAVKVHLDYSNSTSLIPNRSSLVYRLNGEIIGQDSLTNSSASKIKDIVIPRNKLNVGYNTFNVQAIQHYTYECEDEGSSELWTEFNLDRSTVSANVAGDRANEQPRLSQSHIIFDERLWQPHNIVVTTGSNYVSAAQMGALSYVSQGLALRKRNATFLPDWQASDSMYLNTGKPSLMPGLNLDKVKKDAILVGRKSEISRFIDNNVHQAITGPFIGVLPMDGGHKMAMVISGETDEDVAIAAKKFADPSSVMADDSYERASFDKWNEQFLLNPKDSVPFSKLDFRTVTMQGLKPGSTSMTFYAPANYYAKKGDTTTIKLHFAYAGGIRNDSTLLVKLNGNFANSIPLKNEEGQEFTQYEVTLPSEYILAGKNTVEFQPVFMVKKEKCSITRDEHVYLTLYEDSSITLSRASGTPQVPDLARFANSFWPHAKKEGMLVYLPNASEQYIQAMMLLSTEMARKTSRPVAVRITTELPKSEDFVMLSEYGAIPEEIRKNIEGPVPRGAQIQVAQTTIGQKTQKQAVTVISAEDVQDLLVGLNDLSKNEWLNRVKGANSIYGLADKQVQNVMPAKQEDISQSSWTNWLSDYTQQWEIKHYLAALIAAGFLLTITIRGLTKNRSKDRHHDDDEK